MDAKRSVPFARTEFASVTGAPPYARTGMRSRSGLKRTVFYPTIGAIATDFKLHNTYLKPDYFTDPVEEYWACRRVAGLWDVTGEEVFANAWFSYLVIAAWGGVAYLALAWRLNRRQA